MRWILCLGGAACAGPATPPPGGTPPRPFVPFVGLAAAPDVTTDRLCAESADPDAAPDPIFIGFSPTALYVTDRTQIYVLEVGITGRHVLGG